MLGYEPNIKTLKQKNIGLDSAGVVRVASAVTGLMDDTEFPGTKSWPYGSLTEFWSYWNSGWNDSGRTLNKLWNKATYK